MSINPNSDRDNITNVDIENHKIYSVFFKKIKFDVFRQIKDLEINFRSPITVIAGTNKSGKTSILLSIACSHFNFKMRNIIRGDLERRKWGDLMRFTQYDKQTYDWTYYVWHRVGSKQYDNKRGQRKCGTKKWNGVGKKESQIGTPTDHQPNGGRNVVLIDLERITPNRGLTTSQYNKIKKRTSEALDNAVKIEYLSYIFEESYNVSRIGDINTSSIYDYSTSGAEYSSLNSASGEDVLSRIISDIVDAEKQSLILIDEIELGLHPKIQRRLMTIIQHESWKNKKQFIITTHSATILSSVPDKSRIFIERKPDYTYRAINGISVNAALSKMDSEVYPLVDVFIEDNESMFIIDKVISDIQNEYFGFANLVNIIPIGSADKTYNTYIAHKNTYSNKKTACGYACVLDGDMKLQKDSTGVLKYPPEPLLYFHTPAYAPEKFLVDAYVRVYPHRSLEYHCSTSNVHCLFEKMVELALAININNAREMCWDVYKTEADGIAHIQSLKAFLIDICKHFSPEL